MPIRCPLIPIDRLIEFQGGLKALGEDEYRKLRATIEQDGICFPWFIWKNKNQYFILDGHQRTTVVNDLLKEGWILKDNSVPVDFVEAESEGEAYKLLLLAIGQYGKYTPESLSDYLTQKLSEVNFEELSSKISLPMIDLDRFEIDFIKQPGSFLNAYLLGDQKTPEGDHRVPPGERESGDEALSKMIFAFEVEEYKTVLEALKLAKEKYKLDNSIKAMVKIAQFFKSHAKKG